MATFSAFVTNGTRVSRFLKYGSGDSTSAFNFGALPNFKMEWYKTAYAPIYKFIDLQEVVLTLVYWYQNLTAQQAKQYPDGPSDLELDSATQKFYTARQFGIAVRQVIMSIFNDTQSGSQFLRPSIQANGFEALRAGTNCFGKQLNQTLIAPTVLNENIANLLLSTYDFPDEKYHNKKNAQIIVPVWGVFTTSLDINPSIQVWDGAAWVLSPMFIAPVVTDPNYVDCTAGGVVIDVNESDLVSRIIEDWNDSVSAMIAHSVPAAPMGGSSGNGNLLYYTRLYQYITVDESSDAFITSKKRGLYKKMFNNDRVVNKPVTRKNSKKTPQIEIESPQQVLLAPGDGVSTARPVSYTSIAQISDTFKQTLNYLILPFIPLEDDTPPTQNQWRTSSLEAKIMVVEQDENSSQAGTRAAQIANNAAKMAPGIAASGTDTMANVIEALNAQNKGGFFGSLLGGVLRAGATALGEAIPI